MTEEEIKEQKKSDIDHICWSKSYSLVQMGLTIIDQSHLHLLHGDVEWDEEDWKSIPELALHYLFYVHNYKDCSKIVCLWGNDNQTGKMNSVLLLDLNREDDIKREFSDPNMEDILKTAKECKPLKPDLKTE